MNRIGALKKLAFEKNHFDGFAVFNWANLLYLARFPGTAALLIPRDGANKIFAYGVNYEQARAEGKGFRVELVKRGEGLMSKIAENAKNCKIKRLAVDALSVDDWRTLAKETKSETSLKVRSDFVADLRKVKDEEEILLCTKLVSLQAKAWKPLTKR
jgi:Xaa-Pro aminopeptidase